MLKEIRLYFFSAGTCILFTIVSPYISLPSQPLISLRSHSRPPGVSLPSPLHSPTRATPLPFFLGFLKPLSFKLSRPWACRTENSVMYYIYINPPELFLILVFSRGCCYCTEMLGSAS